MITPCLNFLDQVARILFDCNDRILSCSCSVQIGDLLYITLIYIMFSLLCTLISTDLNNSGFQCSNIKRLGDPKPFLLPYLGISRPCTLLHLGISRPCTLLHLGISRPCTLLHLGISRPCTLFYFVSAIKS